MSPADGVAVASVAYTASIGIRYLVGLFWVVAIGSIVPPIPTGAAVSVAAALGRFSHPLDLVLVLAFSAVGAYVGDLGTYALLRLAGEPLARRIGWLKEGAAQETLQRLRTEIERHELRVLLLSRLVPGGRIPVLLAAALGGYPFRKFASADMGAAALWAAVYSAIGILGQAVFPEAWQGVVAAVVLVLLVGGISQLWQRRQRRQRAHVRTASRGAEQGAGSAP
jgi:membrane protein DedA with SNARE-associated domain